MFQFISVFSGVEVMILCKFSYSNLSKLEKPLHGFVSWSLLSAQQLCNAGVGLGLLVPVMENCNATAYKKILDNCALLPLQ